jgi:cobalamin biosynthesis protein CobD/CbiB
MSERVHIKDLEKAKQAKDRVAVIGGTMIIVLLTGLLGLVIWGVLALFASNIWIGLAISTALVVLALIIVLACIESEADLVIKKAEKYGTVDD